MYINLLKIVNFRSYSDLTIEFSKGINIIYGLNGQGKTNILESIYFCAMGSSFRTSRNKELIKWDRENMYTGCRIYTENSINLGQNQKIIEITQNINNKKSAKINKIQISKMEELLGNLKIVSFTPDDLEIVSGGPINRRKFMDVELSQLNPKYYRYLSDYNKVLNNRNSLLKQSFTDKSALDFIDIWDNELVKYGSHIIFWRNEFIKKINDIAKKINKKITNNQEIIDLNYATKFNSLEKIEDINYEYLKLLQQSLNEDKKRGSTSVGPHKDDINIYLGDIDIKNFGSQGQKRTAALSLKLSEIELIKENYKENPIVLLDDVMSELDIKRQNYLLNNFQDMQIIITCTDINNFELSNISEKEYFEVCNGEVFKKSAIAE